MKFKNIFITLLIIIFGIGIYTFFQIKSIKNNSDYLIVGTAAGYAPFVSINAQGEYEGFDVEVAKELAKEMERKLELKDLGSMTSLFTALDQGSIDVIIWGLSITKDRIKKLSMVCYQGEVVTSYPLLFWKKIPENISSPYNMKDKTVCVEPNSAQDSVLSKYPFINKIPTEKVDDALLNLQYGKVDAAFVEPAIGKKFKNKYPEIQILEVPLDPEDQVEGIGITIKQNNAQLIYQVKKAVKKLKSKGIIKKLEEKWNIS